MSKQAPTLKQYLSSYQLSKSMRRAQDASSTLALSDSQKIRKASEKVQILDCLLATALDPRLHADVFRQVEELKQLLDGGRQPATSILESCECKNEIQSMSTNVNSRVKMLASRRSKKTGGETPKQTKNMSHLPNQNSEAKLPQSSQIPKMRSITSILEMSESRACRNQAAHPPTNRLNRVDTTTPPQLERRHSDDLEDFEDAGSEVYYQIRSKNRITFGLS